MIGRHARVRGGALRPAGVAPPRRDPARPRWIPCRRPRLHERHAGERHPDHRARRSSTATRSSSAQPPCATRSPERRDVGTGPHRPQVLPPRAALPVPRARRVGRRPGDAGHAGAGRGRRAAPRRPRRPRKGWRRRGRCEPDAERGRDQWIDGEATIGRGGGCTIALPADTFVSQVHARVVERDGAAVRRGSRFDQRHVPQRQAGRERPTRRRARATSVQVGSDRAPRPNAHEARRPARSRTPGRCATTTRTRTSSTIGSRCSRSPTAWADTSRARSRRGPRSRRSAPRSRTAAPINDAITLANDAVLEQAAGDPKLTGHGHDADGGRRRRRQPAPRRPRRRLARVPHARRRARASSPTTTASSSELVREGRLTPEQAEAHPQRAIVTRALGVDADVDVDVYTVDVVPGDRVVLCSDGLTDMVRDRDIERIAAQRDRSAARRRAPRRRRQHRRRRSTTSPSS